MRLGANDGHRDMEDAIAELRERLPTALAPPGAHRLQLLMELAA